MRTTTTSVLLCLATAGAAQMKEAPVQPLELVITFHLERPADQWQLVDARVRAAYAPRSPLVDGDLVFSAVDQAGATLASVMLNDPCLLVICEDANAYHEKILKPCRVFVSMRYAAGMERLGIVERATGRKVQDLAVGDAVKAAYAKLRAGAGR